MAGRPRPRLNVDQYGQGPAGRYLRWPDVDRVLDLLFAQRGQVVLAVLLVIETAQRSALLRGEVGRQGMRLFDGV